MLQLTKRTEYGLIALIHMAGHPVGIVSVREISEQYPIPRRLLAEVLKALCRADLVQSHRGAGGGYTLSRSVDEITLGEVVSALEGAPSLASCENTHELRNGPCAIQPVCRIRSPLQRIREALWHLMQRTTLRSLTEPMALTPQDLISPVFDDALSHARTKGALS